jgi:rSAM/selenodomain-associated transferase 1
MPRAKTDVGIAILAKAPIEGYAKTRLIPLLGAKGAAELQRRMIKRTVQVAVAAGTGPVSLWCAPNCRHETFRMLAAAHPIELHEQPETDLGRRMLRAFEVLTPHHPLIVIGTDCPVLRAAHLIESAGCLQAERDVVFLPTEDGGYLLVGAQKPWAMLFDGVSWGSSGVMRETRERARNIGLRISEPETVWDIDTPEDYQRAIAAGAFERPTAKLAQNPE